MSSMTTKSSAEGITCTRGRCGSFRGGACALTVVSAKAQALNRTRTCLSIGEGYGVGFL